MKVWKYNENELPCLWDIFDSNYTKQKISDSAYKEIAERLGREMTEISETNNLRAQLRRKTVKVKNTKSCQATSELPKTSWIHWKRLQFLTNQMQSGGIQDTIGIQNSGAELNNVVGGVEKNI